MGGFNRMLKSRQLRVSCNGTTKTAGFGEQLSEFGRECSFMPAEEVQTSSITRAAASIASAILRIWSAERLPRSVRILSA